LGSDIFSHTRKPQNVMKFLYVGTLYNRNIHHTIQGLLEFYNAYSHQIRIGYTIIGDGPGEELKELKSFAASLGLSKEIYFTGRVRHNKLKPFFDSHNIGISYVPITEYYNFQPPTKTYEYLLSGMPVIATKTHENKKVITNRNGVLIPATSAGVFEGMVTMYSKLGQLSSEEISSQTNKYTWKNIVANLSDHYKKLCALEEKIKGIKA